MPCLPWVQQTVHTVRYSEIIGIANRISHTTGSQQSTQQVGEPEAPLDGGSQWPLYSVWCHVAGILSVWALAEDWGAVDGSLHRKGVTGGEFPFAKQGCMGCLALWGGCS